MLTNEEKIEIVINRLNNLKAIRESFIQNEEASRGKYVLQDELLSCDIKKQALINELKSLGGTWQD